MTRERKRLAILKKQLAEESKREREEYKNLTYDRALEILKAQQEHPKQQPMHDFENLYLLIHEEDYTLQSVTKFNWSGHDVRPQMPAIKQNKVMLALMEWDSLVWLRGVIGLIVMLRKMIRLLVSNFLFD